LARLAVATANQCRYRTTHPRHQLAGLADAKMEAIWKPEADQLSPRERAAVRFAQAMTIDASNILGDVYADFICEFTPKERIELAIIATSMGMLNNLNDSLRVPLQSEFEALVARARSGAGADVETVDAERGAEIGARLELFCFERDAGGIGDPVDRIKEANHPGRVGETGRTYCCVQCGARTGERLLVLAEQGFREFDEQTAVGNAAVILRGSRYRVQIVGSIVGQAARTEQQGVTGRSIETLVERRDPRR
jgi:hypothetical protein